MKQQWYMYMTETIMPWVNIEMHLNIFQGWIKRWKNITYWHDKWKNKREINKMALLQHEYVS